ncbi:FecR/PupR family sigma factor regulator, partial [Achromobacter xylosoxidans]
MSRTDALGPAASADEQASRWVIRRSSQPLDPQAQAEFDAWYHADPRHAAAYERLARVWRRMGEIDRGKLAARPPHKRRTALALA